MAVVISVLSAVFGGVLGIVATYFTTRSSMRLSLAHDYDRTLRDVRLRGHQNLFRLTRQIALRWQLAPGPTRSQLLVIRNALDDWYYDEQAYGMFLSKDSKRAYLDLQDALDDTLFVTAADGFTALEAKADVPLTYEELHRLLHLSSELRHQLIVDVGASNPPQTRTTRPDSTVNRWLTSPRDIALAQLRALETGRGSQPRESHDEG